jgi:hypothetical protein
MMQEIMRRASRAVLGSDATGAPYEIRTDAKLVYHPDRYVDGRGADIWEFVTEELSKQENADGKAQAGRRQA